jgi:hypothetical protein
LLPSRAPPDNQHDNADQRDEHEQKPPAAEVSVVNPAHHDGEIGNNRREVEQRCERRAAEEIGISEQVQQRGDYAADNEK